MVEALEGGAMMRRPWSAIGITAIAAIALPVWLEMPTAILWNDSPSAPIGFYQVRSLDRLESPDLVVVDPPEAVERLIIERGYLPPDIPLLKRVVGVPGQTVCRIHRSITVDGTLIGAALDRDSLGRPMPIWQGCRREQARRHLWQAPLVRI